MKVLKSIAIGLSLLGLAVTACQDDDEMDGGIVNPDFPYPVDEQQIWTPQASPTSTGLYDVFFVDRLAGWATGFDIILNTQDGGATWREQEYAGYIVPLSVHFTDESTGWTVGVEGTFLQTTDGGASWINRSRGNQIAYSAVFFVDRNTGWVSVDNGTVLKTENGGEDWTEYPVDSPYPLEDLQFINSQTGWVVGYVGTVFQSTDGGESWRQRAPDLEVPGDEPDYENVHFVSEQTGWVTGRYASIDLENPANDRFFSVLLNTQDGGQTWSPQLTDTLNSFDHIYFLDEQTGWMTLSDNRLGTGYILRTTDGGASWARSPTTTAEPLTSIHLVDEQHGWAVGNEGVILRYSPTP